MNSKFETALYLAKMGFRLFPLKPNGKIPAIKGFSQAATTDEVQLEKWFNSAKDFNIGISTDDLLVVDVDVKNPEKNGVETIERLNAEGKHLPPTKQQVTTTSGLHLIYKAPYPIKNSVSKLGPGLDVRGRGGFIVAAGSTVNGKRYQINKRPVLDPPEWLIEACVAAREEVSHAHETAADVDLDNAVKRAEKYLREIPAVTEGNRNDEAYKTANKLKDIGLDRATCLYLMTDEWRCDPPLEEAELSHVINSAFTYGIEARGSASPEALFAEPIVEPVGGIELDPIDQMNREYAFIMIGGKHKILQEMVGLNGHFTYELLDEYSFHASLASKMLSTGDGKFSQISKTWMRHPKRRSYQGLAFLPEKPCPANLYNLWRGFAVKDLEPNEKPTPTMKRAVENFENHIFENLAQGDAGHFNWVMAWLAHIIQRPWEKPKVALVLKGQKGVGKNVIFETLRPMFPDNYMVSGDKKSFVGGFNGHLERLLLFVADESFWSGDKAAEGILKSLITDDRINIERKGKDTYTIESAHRFVILGNEEWVVPASADERRYAIFEMGNGRKQDRKFFTQLTNDMKAGGIRYLFHKLKHRDISDVDVGEAPQTSELAAQKIQSGSTIQKWWHEALLFGHLPEYGHAALEWPEGISASQLYESFLTFAKQSGRGSFVLDKKDFFASLRRMNPELAMTKGLHVSLGDIEACRSQWEKYIGRTEKWLF